MRPSFRLHEICCCLTDALLAHPGHIHGKNSSPHHGILFAPTCLFEIVLICLSHNTSEIDGSGNLSARELNLERIFACSCIYSARSCRYLSSYPAVSNWLITNQIPDTGNCGSFYFSYFFQIVLYALYNLINVPFDCISFLFYAKCLLFDLLCQVKPDTNILPKLKKFF